MTTDPQTELRDRIAAAMRPHYHCTDDAEQDVIPCACGWLDPGPDATRQTDWDAHIADVVLAELPPPADQAAVLREVADWLKAWRPEFFERWAIAEQDRYEGGVNDAATELRRQAAEAGDPEAPAQPGRPTPAFAGRMDNGQPARADLLNTFASWMFTTRFGSKEAADQILAKHRAEVLQEAVAAMEALMVDGEAEPGALVEHVREMGQTAAEAQQDGAEAEACAHCGKTIRRITGTLTAWWVHDPGGRAFCYPWQPARSTRATPKPADEAQQPDTGTIHGCPPNDSGLTPCCGRTPFELPLGDRISSEAPVTCKGPTS